MQAFEVARLPHFRRLLDRIGGASMVDMTGTHSPESHHFVDGVGSERSWTSRRRRRPDDSRGRGTGESVSYA